MAQSVDVDQAAVNKICHKLAGNDPRVRNVTIRKLKRLLERCSNTNSDLISEISLQRLWKGLHYCMWMADKRLFQQELAEKLATLVDAFKEPEQSLTFVAAFLKIEALEWHLLDFFRLDKFMMLIRKVMYQTLTLLKAHSWELALTEKFVKIVDDTMTKHVASGLVTHVLSVLNDELKRLQDGKLSEDDPWMKYFIEFFKKHHRRLVPKSEKKKRKEKPLTAAECKKSLKTAITNQDIDKAVSRMFKFEKKNVINEERNLKKRKRVQGSEKEGRELDGLTNLGDEIFPSDDEDAEDEEVDALSVDEEEDEMSENDEEIDDKSEDDEEIDDNSEDDEEIDDDSEDDEEIDDNSEDDEVEGMSEDDEEMDDLSDDDKDMDDLSDDDEEVDSLSEDEEPAKRPKKNSKPQGKFQAPKYSGKKNPVVQKSSAMKPKPGRVNQKGGIQKNKTNGRKNKMSNKSGKRPKASDFF